MQTLVKNISLSFLKTKEHIHLNRFHIRNFIIITFIFIQYFVKVYSGDENAYFGNFFSCLITKDRFYSHSKSIKKRGNRPVEKHQAGRKLEIGVK